MDEAVAKTVVTIIAVATIATLIGVIAMISELPGITAEQRKVDRIVQLGIGLVIALLLVLGFVLASPTRAWSRDLDGRYAGSFQPEHSLGSPTLVVSVMEGPLGDAKYRAPIMQIFLNTTERYLYAVPTISSLRSFRNPRAIFETIIPVIVLPLDREAGAIRRPHIFKKIGEGPPSRANIDPAPAIPRKFFTFRIGASRDHGEPHRNDWMAMTPGQSKQRAGDESLGDGIAHSYLVRDNGKYADSPLHLWFDSLKSGKGLCCSYADGVMIEDSDWDRTSDGKHYRVRIPDKLTPGDPMVWVDVPDDAVITEPNRAERTMVWPTYGIGGASVRCFMPGSMS